MTYNDICALCLATESRWFLEVFSEANRTLDMAFIISKHLWFDLKPATSPRVCNGCWTSVHDFHLFYTKLESIHSEDAEEDGNVIEQDGEQPCMSHNITDLNPVDDMGELETTFETKPEISQLGITRKPSSRITSMPLRFEILSTEAAGKDEKKHFVEVIDYASNDEDFDNDHHSEDNALDDDDDAFDADYNDESQLKEQSQYEVVEDGPIPEEQPPTKRRRGRPPKVKLDPDVSVRETQQKTAPSATTESVKRPRGRPPKQKLNEHSMEQNDTDHMIDTKPPVPTTSSTVTVPIKRGRGRPPKRSLEATIKSEPVDGTGGPIIDKAKRKSLRARAPKYESDSDQDYSDYGDSHTKKKSKKRMRNDRDERIFKYVQEFCCHYCVEHVSFKRFIDADRHYKLVHNEPGFLKCTKCEKKCYTPGMFVSHMETHEDPEKNKCEICGKITDCNISLKKHMRVHLGQLEQDLPYPCSRCKRKFASEEQRNKHEKLHVPKPLVKRDKGPDLELLAFYKRIYCDVCEEKEPDSTSFENFWDLRVHMEQEHNKGAYLKCPICGKRNLYRQHLITHIDLHNNPEKYRCEVCKEIYQNLDSHMIKAHTPTIAIPADKKYKCEQCGRMFNFLANLKMHVDCVHGSKDVRCNVCDKYFNLKAFRVHKRTAHTDQLLMCEHCPKMFKTRGALEVHKAIHDDSLVQFTTCEYCHKQIRLTNVKKHMISQHSQDGPVSCELCGKTFRTMFHMKRHQKNTCEATIDSRKHKCEVCGKGFCLKLTMIEHMTTHTRTNKYQCAFCFKSFGYISNLYKHRKKAHPLEWQEIQARPEENIASVIVVRN
ncbi:zinc finger protein 28 homolog [Anopheles maculipalpis]|uniref:zinc finger protein 28 homolog n=1 Tax=Anopheles maculipalpis TaxID=1496333 RepID=UPI0021599904|nr:zinc finger protein 28 homolog [Anopheles maculipalpis]